MTVPHRRCCGGVPIFVFVLFLLAVAGGALLDSSGASGGGEDSGGTADAGASPYDAAAADSSSTSSTLPDEYYRLSKDSVVLITGAAGFLGTELAIALHRTYQPKEVDHEQVILDQHQTFHLED